MFDVYEEVFKDAESFPGIILSITPTPYCLSGTTTPTPKCLLSQWDHYSNS